MFSESLFKKVDKSDMRGVLLDFPNQLEIAREIGQRFRAPEKAINPKMILWCGMGGSAIGGDVIGSSIKDRLKVPMMINRHYNIPSFVNKDTLVVISSYSGNTEETISCYNKAREKKATILLISSGGKLVEMAIRDGVMLIVIPEGLSPRCALGYSSIPVIVAFSKLKLINLGAKEIDETIEILRKLKSKLRPNAKVSGNIALKLARVLYKKIPFIYASIDYFGPVAYRWRTQISENAKMLSSHHLFAEMNHNEIEAFEPFSKVPKDIIVIMLKDRFDHTRIKKRMRIITDIIKRKGTKVIEVNSIGKGVMARIFSVIYIGDWISFYLALLNRVDPTPVDRISYLKKRLVKK